MTNVTRVTLSHNKLSGLKHNQSFTKRNFWVIFPFSVIPPGIANLINLEILNLANNQILELPVSISSMPKLRILNVSINRLSSLPRGFGAFPVLEVLDLSYNNLNEHVLPGNFFMMGRILLSVKLSYFHLHFFPIRNSTSSLSWWQWFWIFTSWNW